MDSLFDDGSSQDNKGEGTPLSLLLPYDEDVLTKVAGGGKLNSVTTGLCNRLLYYTKLLRSYRQMYYFYYIKYNPQ